MATTYAHSTSTTVKNDGGTVAQAGNADTTNGPITKVMTLIAMADDVGAATGSRVIENDGTGANTTDRDGIRKAVSGGTLAFTPDKNAAGSERFIIQGVSTKIGGVANTVLQSTDSDYNGAIRDNIHKLLTTRRRGVSTYNTLAVPNGTITPGLTVGANAGDEQAFVGTADGTTAGTDDAASPTRSVPGELSYHAGTLGRPTSGDYKAKNSYET